MPEPRFHEKVLRKILEPVSVIRRAAYTGHDCTALFHDGDAGLSILRVSFTHKSDDQLRETGILVRIMTNETELNRTAIQFRDITDDGRDIYIYDPSSQWNGGELTDHEYTRLTAKVDALIRVYMPDDAYGKLYAPGLPSDVNTEVSFCLGLFDPHEKSYGTVPCSVIMPGRVRQRTIDALMIRVKAAKQQDFPRVEDVFDMSHDNPIRMHAPVHVTDFAESYCIFPDDPAEIFSLTTHAPTTDQHVDGLSVRDH